MPDEEIDVAAAELALGLLDGEERAAALRRVLAEPGFAAEVERWRLRFAQLFDLWPEAEPPEGLIDRIDLSLGGPTGLARRRLPWPLLATISTAVAATLLVVMVMRPAAAPPPPAYSPAPTATPSPARPAQPLPPAMLVAALGREAPIAAVFEPTGARLRVADAPPVAAGRVPQLWVIGADSVPHALGLLGPGATTLVLADADARRLSAGSTLAVSAEPPGGSPKPTPTGPVVATGALRAV